MHHVTLAPLCAAVSNAGALGFLTAITQPTPELLRAEIRKTRRLTDKPFGVNISFLPAATPPDYEAYIKVILEEGIRIIETAGNNPGSKKIYIYKIIFVEKN
jgi:NAD(P)H-dependent flavin oxidoreductase YrpB (nitropropane dioxygenase family)